MRAEKRNLRILVMVLIGQLVILSLTAYPQDDKKADELKRKIAELEKKKADLNRQTIEKIDKTKDKVDEGQSTNEIIARYEKLYESCQQKKNSRCADVMYTLSKLYYDQARDDYVAARNAYDEEMDRWDKNPVGKQPVNPIPNYNKSLKFYQKSIQEYPDFEAIDEAYYQIGNILLLNGDLDGSKQAFNQVVEKTPNSIRAPGAHFRLADFCFMDRDFTCALKHIEKIDLNQINPEVREMAHYRKAEIYYNRAEFDKAAELFYSYIDKCDAGEYQKKDLRKEALEYLAISFSDMPGGGQKAIDFFKRIGDREYKNYVIYTVGMKNFEHGQYDDAVVSLQAALEKYPYYKDAPVAENMIIACYVIKKKYDIANREREKMVQNFWTTSEWASRNSSDKPAIEGAKNEVRKALSQIPIYYHAEAQKTKQKDLLEKALKWYNEYFSKFPDDKWKIYEYKFNVAEIYNMLGSYEKAADCYQFVAQQDLAIFPKYQNDLDTMMLDPEEKERVLKDMKEKKGPVAISQEDAGYNAIVAIENMRKQSKAKNGVTDEQLYSMPATQKLFDMIGAFQKKFPQSSTTPEILYIGANVHFAAKSYQNAVSGYKRIYDDYPKSEYADKSLRMLANCYAATGEYDLALSTYDKLLAKEKPNTGEYNEIIDLAGGAIFKKADGIRKSGNISEAAEIFKSVYNKFPTSKVAERGWFEAGVCYESAKNLQAAAQVFMELGTKFPKSDLREKSFVRAAEDFKSVEKWKEAGDAYVTAAMKVDKPDFSPLAMYNAGLMYEKCKLYNDAITTYRMLADKYPASEYAPEGFYSLGFCYEKMSDWAMMAKAFGDYAQKYTSNKSKQIAALSRSAYAYNKLNNISAAESTCKLAVDIYDKFKKSDLDIAAVSEAFYTMGEIEQTVFRSVKLSGKNAREVEGKIKEKSKALESVLKAYANAISLGVGEWVIRSTYMIGTSFCEMAEAVRDQTLFGSKDEQVATRIKILSSLEKYYEKAQDKFGWIIETAYENGISNEWVDKSRDEFMRMAYQKGHLLEEVGETFKNAPVPRDLSPEDKKVYQDVLEEKMLEALDAALPKYEESVRAAQKLGIDKSPWLDKIRERIDFIQPTSEALKIEIQPRTPKPALNKTATENKGATKPEAGSKTTTLNTDDRYNRSMKRIRNIMDMSIALDEKVSQIKSIETDANREISKEEERISEIKQRLAGN